MAFSQPGETELIIFESPEGSNVLDSIACNAEKQRAIQDIQAGRLVIEFYGGLTFESRDFDFETFYSNYLIARYKIERVITGCTTDREMKCYFDEMNKAITVKHGISFLQEIKGMAQQEYAKFKSLNTQERTAYIDFDYVYRQVDQRANYVAGLSDLQKKLRERVDFKKFDFSGYELKGFFMEIIVDEYDSVIACNVVSKNFPPAANQALQEAVKEIEGWKAATLYNANVKSITGFSFLF
jgi:hypothetical protein